MLTPRKKRRLTYVTIGIFFLLQGVEYAVILPTLWLYIESRFHGHYYMLGVILSAFSFAGLVSSPIMGRWSDKTRNTKSILLVANVFQFVGSVMYFLGINIWFLVAARAVAGLGSGVGSALFADIARVTSTEERTAVMSVFMAVRQAGLLLGPACNLFLRALHFYIGPFIVDKYTSPGLFMALTWIIHEVLVVVMYWNLPALKLEEMVIKQQEESTIIQSTHSRLRAPRLPDMESPHIRSTFSINASECAPVGRQSRTMSPSGSQRQGPRADSYEDLAYLTSSNEVIENAERFMGYPRPQHPPPIRAQSAGTDQSQNSLQSNHQQSDQSEHLLHSDQSNLLHPDQSNNLLHSQDSEPNIAIGSGSRTNPSQTSQSTYGAISENPDYQHLYDNSFYSQSEYSVDHTEDNAPSEGHTDSHRTDSSLQKISWQFLYQEFVREEIVAILFVAFVSFFNQVGIETLFTPLSRNLLYWGELENSLLFCGAGAEVIAVFFLVRCLSWKFSDRTLLLVGFSVLTVTIAVCTWFIPQAKPEHRSSTMTGLLFLVAFDVFSLPMLAVTSTSLYSKITRPESQGLAQGVRRMFVGIGTILGPLWAGAMVPHLQILMAVMLGICLLAMCMLLASFRHLKEMAPPAKSLYGGKSLSVSGSETAPNGVIVQSWDETQDEHQPLLNHRT